MTFVLGVVLGLCALSLVLVLVLLVVRLALRFTEQRRRRQQDEARDLVLGIVLGEEDDLPEARAGLARLQRRDWHRVEAQMLALMPKVRGRTREVLCELVEERGGVDRALAMLRSRSSVTRCRGAHRLGALRPDRAVVPLIEALGDPHRTVRRVALRAVGSLGHPDAVAPILATADDPALTRDVVTALDRIGLPGAPALREELRRALDSDPGDSRDAELVATALGLVGDLEAVPLLSAAVEQERPRLQAAAARALGRIGSPRAIDALTSSLESPDDGVRREAAHALGEVGDPRAAPALAASLDGSPRSTGRAAAAALLRLGVAGLDALRGSPSPYAVEALAVHDLRQGA